MPKITKRLIDALPPGGERLILWDSELKGFGLVALPSGVRSFIVNIATRPAASGGSLSDGSA